ncbi:MAG: divergent polysaccharide deacetylase family protein, partial [Candidatus Aminicenantes bacterium]|nr:divergent polysaccharide deacetylase family protein [Candidatus Aminicenantes bacterium]
MGRRRRSPGGRGSVLRRPWIVAAAIVVFVLGLDFLGWLTDTESFVFTRIFGKRGAATGAESVALLIEETLASERIGSPVSRFTDEAGTLHLKVSLAPGQFLRLAPALKKRLQAEGAVLSEEQEETDGERTYHLWEVRTPAGGRPARVLFSSRKAGAASEPAAPKARRPVQAAVIMDDLGYNLEAARTACRLGLTLTLSVLPFSPQAVASAQIGHEHGLEIILHLPMESREGHETEKRTPGLLEARMSDEEIRRRVREQIYGVPYIRGANNHMGSLLT